MINLHTHTHTHSCYKIVKKCKYEKIVINVNRMKIESLVKGSKFL